MRTFLAGCALFGVTMLTCPPMLLLGLFGPPPSLHSRQARFFGRAMLWACGARVAVKGLENVPNRPCFLVGNHQSALDIPLLFAVSEGRVRFMAKDSLFRVPLFGWVMRMYGHVPIHRGDARATLAALEQMVERVQRQPMSLVVFPEGTRSPDGGLLPFRIGAMKICQRAGLPVVPFAIDGTLAIHRRGSLRVRSGPARVAFGSPIPPEEAAALSSRELADRVVADVARLLGREAPAMQTAASAAGEED